MRFHLQCNKCGLQCWCRGIDEPDTNAHELTEDPEWPDPILEGLIDAIDEGLLAPAMTLAEWAKNNRDTIRIARKVGPMCEHSDYDIIGHEEEDPLDER